RLDDVLHLLVQAQAARIAIQAIDEIQELPQRLQRAACELSFGDRRGRGAPQARTRGTRRRAHGFDRACADAARRRIDDALERRVVVAVLDEAQVGEGVLDLGALEEPQTAVDAVGDAGREQALLEY